MHNQYTPFKIQRKQFPGILKSFCNIKANKKIRPSVYIQDGKKIANK